MKENSICVDFAVSATFPANSIFIAIVTQKFVNKLNIPPSKIMGISEVAFGSTEPSLHNAMIIDVMKPPIPTQASDVVTCRPKGRYIFMNFTRMMYR